MVFFINRSDGFFKREMFSIFDEKKNTEKGYVDHFLYFKPLDRPILVKF